MGDRSVGASIAKAYIYIKASLGLWTSDAICKLQRSLSYYSKMANAVI